MPTRTIGDEFFKSVGVIARPSVNEHHIVEGDLALLAACDSLFDVMTNEEAAEYVIYYTELRSLVEALKTEVLANRFGMDNLTIIAVSLL